MTRKRNLNLEQTSNYQDQNLHQNFQNNLNQDSFKEQIIAGLVWQRAYR